MKLEETRLPRVTHRSGECLVFMAVCPSCGRDVPAGMKGNTPKSIVMFYYCTCGNKWFEFVKKEEPKPTTHESELFKPTATANKTSQMKPESAASQ